jgi:proline dehydrogenase
MADFGNLGEKFVAGRWVAGAKIEDAIAVAVKLKYNRLGTTINYLGEGLTREKSVEETLSEYKNLISSIKKSGLKSQIAIKASQIGMEISEKTMAKNYKTIITAAKTSGVFVWLDMEERKYVDKVIGLYLSGLKNGNTGICIQSYLKRSQKDIEKLVKRGGTIRLVKGAYPEHDYEKKTSTQNYAKLMEYLFKHSRQFMIATHDSNMIKLSRSFEAKYKKKPWYGILNGIRGKLAKELALQGEQVFIYLPYGRRWLNFAYRRMKEAGTAKLLLRSILPE